MSIIPICELLFDLEIEKTAKRLRKEARLKKQQPPASSSSSSSEDELSEQSVEVEVEVDRMANNRERTLCELAVQDVNQPSLCIEYPEMEVDFELKSGLIHLLPKFHGLENEDPHKHLKEFHVVCITMKPKGVTKDQIKLRAFSFSLEDRAKDWLLYLPSNTATTWEEMGRLFLERFFPTTRATSLRKEITGVRQKDSETLFEYWERFKRLCASCPQHGISELLLVNYLYERLLPAERKWIDASCGGTISEKTPTQIRKIISDMAEASQQYGRRQETHIRRVNEVSSSSIESQLSELTSLVKQLATRDLPQARACGIFLVPNHPTHACPTLQEDAGEQVNAAGGFPGPPRRNYDPYSNTYNPGWRDHPNLRYGNNPQSQQYHPKQTAPQRAVPPTTPLRRLDYLFSNL
ncbi:hypothetical protein C2S52_011804 [Perilla frutescens var. hirtella]|nr:hypothetical protein C2S52_011804 [Perilla frutescens var. hirtella]